MKLGVIGLPNVGKSTLFNALTKSKADAANYPFCTIEPNVGIVTVPDERLNVLAKMNNAKKIIPAVIEFVDIAGLVKGASKGEGLGNKFLSHIREVDAVVHVVRAFDNDKITHVDGSIDPIRDIQTIELELILADIESISKRLDKARSMAKTGDKVYTQQAELMASILDTLNAERTVRSMHFNQSEQEFVDQLFLLTAKPVIYAANVSEEDISKDIEDIPQACKIYHFAKAQNCQAISVCAKIEEELSELEDEDRELFMEDLNLKSSGLQKLITAGYELLGLISYITAGEKEVRAWTIARGTKAPQAAGKIHTDFEKGFIRAEVIDYDTLIECGSMAHAKEKGKVRIEGKEYVFKDGDVTLFRFNV